MRILLAALCFTAIAGSALAASNGLTISDAWSRATPSAAGSAVVYFTVTDAGAPDTLTGASTPVAAKAELHDSTMDNGVMRMRPVTGGVTVDASHPFKASPNGYHLMLTGLKQPLKAGSSFPLTLTFATAGAVSTTVTVKPAATAKPMDMNMDGMDMSH
jgi:copper(I)-binding protein